MSFLLYFSTYILNKKKKRKRKQLISSVRNYLVSVKQDFFLKISMSSEQKIYRNKSSGSLYTKNTSKHLQCQRSSNDFSPLEKESSSEIPKPSKKHQDSMCTINNSRQLKIKRSKTLGPTYTPEIMISRSKSLDSVPGLRNMKSKNDLEKCKQSAISYTIADRTLKELGYDGEPLSNWRHKNDLLQKPHLYDLLREMIENYIKPNLLVCIGNWSFKCHLTVLQCYSQFFRDCCTELVIFLPETKVSSVGFEAVYEWMINDTPRITRQNILELYRTAQFLGVEDLLNQCWSLIGDEDIFVEDMAFLLFLEASTYDIQLIKNLILPRIFKFFLVAVSSKDFMEIKVEDVILLLSSNSIGVNSEIEVFFSAVRWLNFDWKKRKSYAQQIMECIRFALMPPWFLVTLEKVELGLEVNRVIHHVDIRKHIKDGLSYATTVKHFLDRNVEFNKVLKSLNLSKPMERNWILDSRCLHHHYIDCPRMRLFTYKSFLAYLLTLHKREKNYWQNFISVKPGHKQCYEFCSVSDLDVTAPPNEHENWVDLGKFGKSSTTISAEFSNHAENQPKLSNKNNLKIIGDHSKNCLKNCEAKDIDITKRFSDNLSINNTRIFEKLQVEKDMNAHKSNSEVRQHEQCYNPKIILKKHLANSKILIFGGLDPILKEKHLNSDVHGNNGNRVIIYDNQSGSWKYLTEIPSGPRRHFCAVECGGKVYVLGGTLMKRKQVVYETNVWSFDTNSLKWTLESKIPQTGKNFATVAVASKKGRGIYLMGGQNMQGRILDTVWFFDVLQRIWTKKPSLIIPRYGCMAAVINNEIMVAGGIIESNRAFEENISADEEFSLRLNRDLTITSSVECYCLEHEHGPHLERKKWYMSAHCLREPRVFGRFCFCSNSHLYLSGGIGQGKNQSFKILASIDRYNFHKNDWVFFTNMDLSRYGHDMVEYRESLLFVGGVHGNCHDNQAIKEIFMCDIETGEIKYGINSLPWPLSGCHVIILKG